MLNYPMKLRNLFSKPLRHVRALACIINIIAIPYSLISAKLLSEIVSSAINGEVDHVLKLSVIAICFIVLYKLILTCFGLSKSLKDMKSTHHCKMILYHYILTSPLNLLFLSTTGDILENLTDDFKTVTSAPKSLYPNFTVAVLTVIVYSFFIGVQSVIIILALIFLSLLQIVPPLIIRKYMQINYELSRNAESDITDFIVAGYEGMATIKLFDLNHWYLDKLKHIHTKALKAGKKAELTGAAENSITSIVSSLLQYGMYGVIGVAIFFSKTTLEVGMQAIALSGGLFGAVKVIFDCIPQFALVRKSEERLSKWFNHNIINKHIINSDYVLSLENISYQYDSYIVLNNLNLKIKYDELILLKGKNGVGKTTLLRIITGLIPLQKGTIAFGSDVNINSLEFWGDILFYLPQEDVKFDTTAVDLCEMLKHKPNIANFEEWGISEHLIESANISDLSGGERKKVYLAIAFAVNPKILILDEPSNSLDLEAKEFLCKKLLQRSNATLVVTHDDYFDSLTPIVYNLEEGEIRFEKRC